MSADDWPSKIGTFLIGGISEPKFLAAALDGNKRTDEVQHCEAWFYAGTKRLVLGDKTTAKEYFEKCRAFDMKGLLEWGSALAELRLLEAEK